MSVCKVLASYFSYVDSLWQLAPCPNIFKYTIFLEIYSCITKNSICHKWVTFVLHCQNLFCIMNIPFHLTVPFFFLVVYECVCMYTPINKGFFLSQHLHPLLYMYSNFLLVPYVYWFNLTHFFTSTNKRSITFYLNSVEIARTVYLGDPENLFRLQSTFKIRP